MPQLNTNNFSEIVCGVVEDSEKLYDGINGPRMSFADKSLEAALKY